MASVRYQTQRHEKLSEAASFLLVALKEEWGNGSDIIPCSCPFISFLHTLPPEGYEPSFQLILDMLFQMIFPFHTIILTTSKFFFCPQLSQIRLRQKSHCSELSCRLDLDFGMSRNYGSLSGCPPRVSTDMR